MIVENGVGAVDELIDGQVYDLYCINYLREHIVQLVLAINEFPHPLTRTRYPYFYRKLREKQSD